MKVVSGFLFLGANRGIAWITASFFFQGSGDHRDLHSFPTRRSSDLWDPAQKLWAISRYGDVMLVEKDAVRFSSYFGSRPHIDQRADRSMINMDDPEHQAQRNVV